MNLSEQVSRSSSNTDLNIASLCKTSLNSGTSAPGQRSEMAGYGLAIAETNLRVEYIERTMTFLPDNEQVYSIWRQLVIANNVRGVQVHDARLAATMKAYGVSHILTLNQPDFLRYSDIQTVHPNQVQPSP